MYSDTDNEIFQKYLEEVETGIAVLKEELSRKLREDDMPLDQRKRLIANLVHFFNSISSSSIIFSGKVQSLKIWGAHSNAARRRCRRRLLICQNLGGAYSPTVCSNGFYADI